MNIAIIDDVLEDRELLSHHLHQYFDDRPIHMQIDLFSSAEEFLDIWSKGLYDLVFIDIYLDKMDGVQLTAKLREGEDNCLIVFTSQSREHALAGYRLRVIDYLIKPITYQMVTATLDYYANEIRRRNRFIQVKESRSYVKILLDDILFTDYFNHYIQIHTVKRMVRSYMKFDDFSPLLLCYPQFLCCYRNCIVNMDKVQSVSRNDFILVNEERVPLTRSKRQELHQTYMDYQFEKLRK